MDLERTMTFIVEQQAKFETDIAKINDTLSGLNEMARIQNQQAQRNNEAIRDLVEVTRLQSERVDGLHQAMAEMAQAHKDLTKTQKETARRLNDLITQVSRHVAGGNGRGKKPGSK
jgi:chromosome segregation ATPase